MKTFDRFKLIVTDYQKILSEYAAENSDYFLKKSELLDEYGNNDKIFQFFSSYDAPNAVRIVPDDANPKKHFVVLTGDVIGVVKSGSVSRIRNLMSAANFAGLSVNIYGGKYKQITYDGGVDNFSDREFYADLLIYHTMGEAAPSVSVVAASATEKTQKRGLFSRLLGK